MIVAALALVLAACGPQPAEAPAPEAPAEAAPEAAEEPAAEEPAAEEPAAGGLQIPEVEEGKFNVAAVLIGPHDDGGWSQAHYEGLLYIEEMMADSHVAYIENVPEGADSEQVFRSLARKGFDFILGTSFGYMDPMGTVAEEFPEIVFQYDQLRQSIWRDGEYEVLGRNASRLACQIGRQSEGRLHGHVPDPGGDPPRQRHHVGREGNLPGMHDGHPLDQHLA
jgi:hypothetical protein